MKKSDIYEIAIKIFGLYLFVSSLDIANAAVTYLGMVFAAKENPEIYGGYKLMPFVLIHLFNFFLVTFFSWLFIFRTNVVSARIYSPSDIEKEVHIISNTKEAYQTIITLTGLILIVWTIPDFLLKLNQYIYLTQQKVWHTSFDDNFLITASVKIVLGILIILFAKHAARYFVKDLKENGI